MGAPFFFSENTSPENGAILLDEESSRHIVQVLRMKSGEKIMLTDGRGALVQASIADAHKKHCTVEMLSASFIPRRGPALTIAISLTKNIGRLEWFLEKATELGTAEIIPLLCDRTEKQHARQERLISICKSAMLQSTQAWMPVVHAPTSFADVARGAAQQQKLFGHIAEKTKKLAATIDPARTSHMVMIGPEGDFSDGEVSLAMASGFDSVSFGSTILRVETAGIYAAVVHAALV